MNDPSGNYQDDPRPFVQDGRRSGDARTPRGQRQVYGVPTYSRVRSGEHRMHWGCLGAVLAFLAVVIGLAVWFSVYEYGTETSAVFTVRQLDDQSSGSSHKYLIFTEVPGTTKPAEVFEDTDAWFHGKWNSSNLYSNLTAGSTYRCTVYGFRNGVLSSYRDLLVCSRITVAQARGQYAGEMVKAVSS